MHTFTVLPVSAFDHSEIMESEKLMVVEFKNERCYHSTFVVMQENRNCWMMPDVLDTCPTLDSAEYVLVAIQRGREVADRLKLENATGKQLMQLGSIVYDTIEAIMHNEYE